MMILKSHASIFLDNMNRLYTSRVGTGETFTINYSDNGNITSVGFPEVGPIKIRV